MPKKGNIFVPLVIILGLSFGILSLANFFSQSQADVSQAIESRYSNSTALSSKMDKPENWTVYTNNDYGCSFKYPKQWTGNNLSMGQNGNLVSYTRNLSNKVILRMEVKKQYSKPKDSRLAKFSGNDFYYFDSEEDSLLASIEKNGLVYVLSFKNNGYFVNNLEFVGTFYKILQSFQFLN